MNRKIQNAFSVQTGNWNCEIRNERYQLDPSQWFQTISYEFKWYEAVNMFQPAGKTIDRGRKYIYIKAGSLLSAILGAIFDTMICSHKVAL